MPSVTMDEQHYTLSILHGPEISGKLQTLTILEPLEVSAGPQLLALRRPGYPDCA